MNSAVLTQTIIKKPAVETNEWCIQCHSELCRNQIIFNLALGYTDSYICISCLAKDKNQAPMMLFNYLLNYIQTRPCYMVMWSKSRCDETRRADCPYSSICK